MSTKVGCLLFRGCLCIEVNIRTVGTFLIVNYIVVVHCSGGPLSGVPLCTTTVCVHILSAVGCASSEAGRIKKKLNGSFAPISSTVCTSSAGCSCCLVQFTYN